MSWRLLVVLGPMRTTPGTRFRHGAHGIVGIANFNWGFCTHQQCMANGWGNGGLCVANPRAPFGDVHLRRRR
jgi:hypothetical protein